MNCRFLEIVQSPQGTDWGNFLDFFLNFLDFFLIFWIFFNFLLFFAVVSREDITNSSSSTGLHHQHESHQHQHHHSHNHHRSVPSTMTSFVNGPHFLNSGLLGGRSDTETLVRSFDERDDSGDFLATFSSSSSASSASSSNGSSSPTPTTTTTTGCRRKGESNSAVIGHLEANIRKSTGSPTGINVDSVSGSGSGSLEATRQHHHHDHHHLYHPISPGIGNTVTSSSSLEHKPYVEVSL